VEAICLILIKRIGAVSMRPSLWGLVMLVLGIGASVLSGGNLIVVGLSGLLILGGLLVFIAVEIASWLQSHEIFRPPKTYGGLVSTHRGETVRSNSERTIADYFHRNNIRYVYEQDAMNRWNSRRISRPDFYLPDYGIYVEYWGVLGVEDASVRSRYERSMKWKMAQYHRNNIKFISIYPNSMSNLDWVFRAKFREVAGYDLPSGRGDLVPARFCTMCGTGLVLGSLHCQSCGMKVAG
jgi:hypothetical protein